MPRTREGGRDTGDRPKDRPKDGLGADPLATRQPDAGTAVDQPGVGTPPAPGPGEAPPESPQGPPIMPPGASSATPLGAGTFALPGQGAASAPFRTMDFWSNRFVGGPGNDNGQGNGPDNMVGTPGGGNPATPPPLDPETLRRILGGALHGQGLGPGGY